MGNEVIRDDLIVSIHYTLTNDAGEVLDGSAGRDPLEYLHGAGNIVPGLESQLLGKAIGDELTVRVPPEEGYGTREGDPQRVDRKAFPAGLQIDVGMMFQAQSPDGDVVPLWVARVEDDAVWVDPNHPLAGVVLTFAVQITGIREASPEELEHGHPHGPGGHHH